MSKTVSLLSALLCTFIWGTTFIAQDTGMDNIGPFTFNAVRFFVGFLAIVPLVFLFEVKKFKSELELDFKTFAILSFLIGLSLFLGSALQQVALLYTDVANAGFFTIFYVPMVPIIIFLFRKTKEKLPIKPVSEQLDRFIASKKLVSIVLLPTLFFVCLFSFANWFNGVFVLETFDGNLNNLFFNEFFTILILADVFILLLSFQYTERYSQLIRNTGFIISTILLRLSFSASGLSSIVLIISGILFGLIILLIYNAIEKESS